MSHLKYNYSDLAVIVNSLASNLDYLLPSIDEIPVYAIPRGGVNAALFLKVAFPKLVLVDNPDAAMFYVDDIIDSGATFERYCKEFGNKPLICLVSKLENPSLNVQCGATVDSDQWVTFPWEVESGAGIEDNILRILQFVGEDVKRGGLLETPSRVVKAWKEWTSGYEQTPESVLKVFEDGAEQYDEMVIVKDIPFYSHCEHHMAPFFGTATIGYIPNGKIVGLSKLSRLLDIYSKRLQVQERLTAQVADALMEHLDALGAGVVITARHMCMESRGVCKQGHTTITSTLRGVMKTQSETRSEFIALSK